MEEVHLSASSRGLQQNFYQVFRDIYNTQWSQLISPKALKDRQKNGYRVVGWTLSKLADVAEIYSVQLKF